METIKSIIAALLIALPSLAGLRAMYCLGKMATDYEQGSLYLRRLKNLLVFAAIAESFMGLLYAVLSYIASIYGGTGGKF